MFGEQTITLKKQGYTCKNADLEDDRWGGISHQRSFSCEWIFKGETRKTDRDIEWYHECNFKLLDVGRKHHSGMLDADNVLPRWPGVRVIWHILIFDISHKCSLRMDHDPKYEIVEISSVWIYSLRNTLSHHQSKHSATSKIRSSKCAVTLRDLQISLVLDSSSRTQKCARWISQEVSHFDLADCDR